MCKKLSFFENFELIKQELTRRVGKKLSYEKLGNLLGVHRLTIYYWTNSKRTPKPQILNLVVNKINELLDTSFTNDDLLYGDVSKVLEEKRKLEKNKIDVKFADHDNTFYSVGERIKQLRKERGWSLKDLAEKIRVLYPHDKDYHLSHTHIKAIEDHAISSINLKKIVAIANALKVPLEYLLFGWGSLDQVTYDPKKNILIVPLNEKFRNKSRKEIEKLGQQIGFMLNEIL